MSESLPALAPLWAFIPLPVLVSVLGIFITRVLTRNLSNSAFRDAAPAGRVSRSIFLVRRRLQNTTMAPIVLFILSSIGLLGASCAAAHCQTLPETAGYV